MWILEVAEGKEVFQRGRMVALAEDTLGNLAMMSFKLDFGKPLSCSATSMPFMAAKTSALPDNLRGMEVGALPVEILTLGSKATVIPSNTRI